MKQPNAPGSSLAPQCNKLKFTETHMKDALLIIDMLNEQGKTVVLGEARLENREALFAEIERVKPTHILDAAGVTGR